MVSDCFCGCRKGPLVPIRQSITAVRYLRLLQRHIILFITALLQSGLINLGSQQDNAPVYKVYIVMDWLYMMNIQVEDHPPYLPDHNLIEHVLIEHKKRLEKKYSRIGETERGKEAVKKTCSGFTDSMGDYSREFFLNLCHLGWKRLLRLKGGTQNTSFYLLLLLSTIDVISIFTQKVIFYFVVELYCAKVMIVINIFGSARVLLCQVKLHHKHFCPLTVHTCLISPTSVVMLEVWTRMSVQKPSGIGVIDQPLESGSRLGTTGTIWRFAGQTAALRYASNTTWCMKSGLLASISALMDSNRGHFSPVKHSHFIRQR